MPPPESVTTLKPALICATDYRRPPRGIRRSAGHVHGHGGEDRGGHGGRCGTGEREPAGAHVARVWPGLVPIAMGGAFVAAGLAARAGCACQEQKVSASGAATAWLGAE